MPEDSQSIANWRALAQNAASWMEAARRMAVAGFGQVMEDGTDVCGSESDSENSDHGEMWGHSGMYTPIMLGPDGKPKAGGPQQPSAAQANATRASAKLAVSQASV
jgi:hypothetical protein